MADLSDARVRKMLASDEKPVVFAKARYHDALVVLTDRDRLLVLTDSAKPSALDLHDLHSVAVFPASSTDVLFTPLRRDESFMGIYLDSQQAQALALAVRTRLAELRAPGTAWWDSPLGDIAVRLPSMTLLVRPPTSQRSEGSTCVVSFANTGVQITATKGPRGRDFIPWSVITDVSIEGVDQIQQRPSVAAVVMFGVLGLGARRKERRSYLALVVDSGDYVIENEEMLPRQLAGVLAPILRHFGGKDAAVPPADALDADPIDQIRRLGELRDAAFITVEEFDAKKSELLGRL